MLTTTSWPEIFREDDETPGGLFLGCQLPPCHLSGQLLPSMAAVSKHFGSSEFGLFGLLGVNGC